MAEFQEGSYVKPIVGHMEGQKGHAAKVLKAVTGTFYILDFGNGPHKWYAEDELKKASAPSDEDLKKAAEKAKNGSLEDRAKYASMKRSMNM